MALGLEDTKANTVPWTDGRVELDAATVMLRLEGAVQQLIIAGDIMRETLGASSSPQPPAPPSISELSDLAAMLSETVREMAQQIRQRLGAPI